MISYQAWLAIIKFSVHKKSGPVAAFFYAVCRLNYEKMTDRKLNQDRITMAKTIVSGKPWYENIMHLIEYISEY